MVNLKPCVQLLTILLRCPLSALRGGEQCDEVAERGEVIWRCWIQYSEGGKSALPGTVGKVLVDVDQFLHIFAVVP